ncbi:MAG: 50S ribosomal protein L10 [Gammaproteobacteria bacterium]|nr:50S ribosomal protein L10 [Gammaproteobacteria bacterium]
MALRLEQKQKIVAEVNEVAASALSAVLADYRGLTVKEMTELRARARASGVYLKVVRNTLAKRALAGTDYACLDEALVGPTMVAFSQEDPGSAARLINECTKVYKALEVKALSIDGVLLGPGDIARLAQLPTRDEALALLMSVMLAPITKLARTFNEVPGKLVRTLAAVGEQKQVDG